MNPLPLGGIRMVSTSSQFLKAARWSSPQNFDRALSVGKSINVLVNPRAAQSAARRLATERSETGRPATAPAAESSEYSGRPAAESSLPRGRSRSRCAPWCRPERLAGREHSRLDRRRELREHRRAVGAQSIQDVGEEPAAAPRLPACRSSSCFRWTDRPAIWGRRIARVAPRSSPRIDADLLRGRLDDRFIGLDARKRQHRLADDTDAHPLERPLRAGRGGCGCVGLVEHGRPRDST